MAQYVARAAQLKPLVEQAGFTAEQLDLIHSMMRGCTMLRQGSVISNFLNLMLPDSMELRQGAPRQGKYGTYRPVYVVKKGTEWTEPVTTEAAEDSTE